ncbi:hypothetical protein Rsub_07334 [Raphidocelis subcapitata]|uniref:phosphoribosylaminoimidazole carboxylase n=1 Tax=Raphidocelis subcapitata TaxID=307507 RepID=A0A2V0P2I2_9CHLO|nr:hypothetical protein Rsub_07334 [Raphidocelis subcapitata]|eukprot:GBF94066.1 hypothetical protein Rsub_07334 [Raphidocelis subcapitata]
MALCARLSRGSRPVCVRPVASGHAAGMGRAPLRAKPATGDRDLRVGAAPHSMPSPPPTGSAGRPHQPLPLIVHGAGQSPETIAAAMREHLANLQHQAIATGIEPSQYARVRELLPGVKYQARARCLMVKSEDGALQRLPGTVGLVGGGDADAAAMDQARLLLQHLGAFVISKDGLAAADAASLAAAAPALHVCDVVIVVAGADAGLPAAVADMVDAPVLAAPSIASGVAALPLGAAPVAVTAADDGASAAVMAARMLRTAATRAVQIAEAAAAAAAHPQLAAASAGEAAAHSLQH